jgi:hypothetical protein
MWASEHEKISKTEFFLEYFVNNERILKKYSLTHDIKYIMMWRNIFSCIYGWMIIMDEQNKKMKNWNWWKTKMDKKLKWMNTTCLQPRIMCQCKLYLFTTKRSMSTKTLPIHLQEVCSHWELNNMRLHILNTISHCFAFEFNLSNLLCLRWFLPLEEKNRIISPISTRTY